MKPSIPPPSPSPAILKRAVSTYQRVMQTSTPLPIETTWRPAPPPGQGLRLFVGLVLGGSIVLIIRLFLQ